MKITFNRDKLLNLEFSLKKEYLLTNGKGGYCSSTILDCHTRKYHGLLNVPVAKFGKSFNLLSKVETIAIVDGCEFELSTNKYPGVFYPTGHQFIEEITVESGPVTRYKIGDVELLRSMSMVRGADTVLIRWDYAKGKKEITLKLLPFLAYRDIHSETRENLTIRPRTYAEKNGFKISPYKEMPVLYMQTSLASEFFPSPLWINNLEYLKERNRGYNYQEDLFSPGVFEVTLKKGESLILRASTEKLKGFIKTEWTEEERRRRMLADRFVKEKEPLRTLKIGAEDYLYENEKGMAGIMAGYHWFGEWGRDTLISLAGITLLRGEKEKALDILEKYGWLVKDGLLPNIVSVKGEHAYNSIDSALFYFWAVQHYLVVTNDWAAVRKKLLKSMEAIVRDILNGKCPVASIGQDGLFYAGNENTNLTWMDAMIYGRPVTSRHGAAVELNALWYNALSMLEEDFGEQVEKSLLSRIADARRRFAAVFQLAFWNDAEACLYDVVRHPESDCAIRPNQLFAVGLPYTCLDKEIMIKVVDAVKRHLVTPYGLRTLSPDHADYCADYSGDQNSRDNAYHQGTVWPWLIGIFTDAVLKTGTKKEAKSFVFSAFDDLLSTHLSRYGLNHVSEIFTPSLPYAAKGCMAQAWSEAELIRALERLK
ncbi:MAG: hypothetical protein A2293_10035 [Elusimicrobia bacterium RIFOXYB2_FULL_49_7]|nr:MAG: hypothetical protein A2293_10035 [Elusimicrobia bacterium RIFOXYB2_FULL_49_7]